MLHDLRFLNRLENGQKRLQQIGDRMPVLLDSASLWKEGSGYYPQTVERLSVHPQLPDFRRWRDKRFFELFRRFADLGPGRRALEIGCGSSPWLPFLTQQTGCAVGGIEIEPYAAELARANLAGAKSQGEVFCRDGFDAEANADLLGQFDLVYSLGVMEHFPDPVRRFRILRKYLKPRGRIITTVPNMHGMNWALQRIASRERLNMHVAYDPRTLATVHTEAGFQTIKAGYVGFHDGWLSAPLPTT